MKRVVVPEATAEEAALVPGISVRGVTWLAELVAHEPPAVQAEILRINTVARPPALQVALLVPLLAGILGLLNSIRMVRLKDPKPSGAGDMALGG